MSAPLFCLTVFDGPLAGNPVVVYSPIEMNGVLAQADKFLIQFRAAQSTGTSPALEVKLERSNDNENWNAMATVITAANGALSLTAVTNTFGTESGTNIGGCFVRVVMTLTGANANTNVKVMVTGREA